MANSHVARMKLRMAVTRRRLVSWGGGDTSEQEEVFKGLNFEGAERGGLRSFAYVLLLVVSRRAAQHKDRKK